eukprot:7578735-Pyramimonas_sp.AAC.1
MSRLHVGDLVPYFRLKAACTPMGQPKTYELHIMYNSLAASPFMDESVIAAVNRARGQHSEGPKEPLKLPPITAQQFRQAVHQAIAHTGGTTIQGSAPPSTLELALQSQLRARQMRDTQMWTRLAYGSKPRQAVNEQKIC